MLHIIGEQRQKWSHIVADGLRQLLLYNLKQVQRRWTQISILMESVELLKQLCASVIAKLSAKTEALRVVNMELVLEGPVRYLCTDVLK